jgi:hypothetical protein
MPKYLITTSQTFYYIVNSSNDDMEQIAETFVNSDDHKDLDVEFVTSSELEVQIAELHHPDSVENILGMMGGGVTDPDDES